MFVPPTLREYYRFIDSLRQGRTVPETLARHPYSGQRLVHMDRWSSSNIDTLRNLLSDDLFRKVIDNHLDVRSSTEIMRRVELHLFADLRIGRDSFIDLLRTRRSSLRRRVDDLVSDATRHWRLGESLKQQGYCLVLIRPEIMYLSALASDLLRAHGYFEVISREVVLTPAKYVALYSHVFLDEVKEAHVRRRAFGYVNQICRALVLRRGAAPQIGLGPAEYLSSNVKGSVLIENRWTLRGGIGISEALVNYVDKNKVIRIALDPMKTYTHLDNSVECLPPYKRFASNLHSVHIPSASELVKDLCVCFGPSELRAIDL